MNGDYIIQAQIPFIDDYLRLRHNAGLTARSTKAALAGLPHSAAAVIVRSGGDVVGMGRAIGDGLFYQIVDIAVEPEHQGRGLGKAIITFLMEALKQMAPAEAFVSLIADGKASDLYAQFGFAATAPASIGMAQWLNR